MYVYGLKSYDHLGMGPYYKPHENFFVNIIGLVAVWWNLLKKSGFQSGLDLWKSGLEGLDWNNNTTIPLLLL